jgi:hypothetical protein
MFDFESDAKMHRTPTPNAFASPAHRDKDSADLQFPLRTVDTTALIPADLASFVLFFEPAHQRLEIFHHRASGDIFAGRFL